MVHKVLAAVAVVLAVVVRLANTKLMVAVLEEVEHLIQSLDHQ